MPRPRKDALKHRPINLTVRVSAEDKRRLMDAAHAQDKFVSDIIHEALILYWEAQK